MAVHWMAALDALLLVVWANAAPVVARLFLHERWSWPVDGDTLTWQGHPLLGPSKTWRGLIAALLTTPLVALILGLPWWVGLGVAMGAMLGDLTASFLKRRLGYRSSQSALLLDQIPESLLPALLLQETLGLTAGDIALVVMGFFLVDVGLTPVGMRLRSGLGATLRRP